MLELVAQKNPFDNLQLFFQRLEKPGSGEQHKIADAITQGFAESFSREGNADGKWRPLAPLTIRLRQQRGYAGAHPILMQTGRTRASWTQRGAADHVELFQSEAGGWVIRVGTRSAIAAKHEFGEDRVPARPVQPISGAAVERIVAVLDFVIDQIEAQTVGR